MKQGGRHHSPSVDDRVLHALAHQIKVPFMQIARTAEMAKLSEDLAAQLDSIAVTADAALRLLDSYLLGAQLLHGQQTLDLEPVSVSSVLYEAAQHLNKVASEYQCELELHVSGKYGPVMANREGLESALVSLGYVFIEAQSQQENPHNRILKLAAHRSKEGIVAGVFAPANGLGANAYRRAGVLYGRARQPLQTVTANTGAGIFVADSILNAMSTRLRLAHHQKLVGLAATLIPSNQLSLV